MKVKSSVFKNILYAFGAQGLSMVLSVLMALFLPKVLGVTDYSYWQLFIFYISYAGFFHLGLNDGVYLKLGGKKYEDLDFSLLNANLIISTISQLVICGLISFIAAGFMNLESARSFTIVCTAAYIIVCNYGGFFTYILQISNRIKEYSLSVVIDKVGFMLVVLIGILTRSEDFRLYVVLYICTKIISTGYSMIRCHQLIQARPTKFSSAYKEVFDNIKVGMTLTISNVASMLILGFGRSMIDSHWGVEAFGKFSLALSLSNFFLQFISQVSLVLFPTFRRLQKEQIADYYKKLRAMLSLVLSGMLLLYMPMYFLLSAWLPQYSESLRYMVILLPICTFDGKMNMLCNTYLKVLRKEKMLLRFNLITMLMSLIMCSTSTYIIENIYAVTISMVAAIVIRSIIAEMYLSRYFNESITISILMEISMAVIFVSSTWVLGAIKGFAIYLISYIIFCIIKKNEIQMMLSMINRKRSL